MTVSADEVVITQGSSPATCWSPLPTATSTSSSRTERGSTGARHRRLDFVQSADRLDSTRVNIVARWNAEEPMLAFRQMEGPEIELPPIVGADVKRYLIASVEVP